MSAAKKEVEERRKLGKPKIEGELINIVCRGLVAWDDEMGCSCDFSGTPKCTLCGKLASWKGKITTRQELIQICDPCVTKLRT